MPNNLSGIVGSTIGSGISFSLSTDLPRHMGGQNTAPQPMEWLLAAFIGCTQATAHFVARHYRNKDDGQRLVMLQHLEFHNITATRDVRGSIALPIEESMHHADDTTTLPSSRIQHLSGTIRVYFQTSSDDHTQRRAECLRVIQTQTERRCPVANTIAASGCRMDLVWEDGGALSVPVVDSE